MQNVHYETFSRWVRDGRGSSWDAGEVKLTFWGAARTVTGSMHHFEANGKQYLFDCGLFQGRRKEAAERNCCFGFVAKYSAPRECGRQGRDAHFPSSATSPVHPAGAAAGMRSR